mgnify:CR=1 FL=1
MDTPGPAVVVDHLVRRFGEFTAVDDVSFTVEAGELFGFLGPNGAGKTTTISILCTLQSPSGGTARVAGHDVVTERDEVRRNIGERHGGTDDHCRSVGSNEVLARRESRNQLEGTRGVVAVATQRADSHFERSAPLTHRTLDIAAGKRLEHFDGIENLHQTRERIEIVDTDARDGAIAPRYQPGELVAESGVAAHYIYKQGGQVDEEIDARLGGFVTQIAGWQREAEDDEYMDFLRTALHQEEVFVYTPRRELKRLAKGATPLDFAFLIHSEVGAKCVGARVNGELVPLRHELRNGDMVEIITSPQARPHEDWLKIARTTHARAKIRHWLRLRRLADSVALGKEMLEREFKRMRLKPDAETLKPVLEEFECEDLETLHAHLAEGRVSMAQVLRRFQPAKPGLAERLTQGPLEALGIGRKASGGVRMQGIDNIMVSYARCCQPVPGDPVVGIVTIGRGVSVHRQDCPNTFGDRVATERRVAVEWDTRASDTFPVRLVVTGQDRASLLADLAKVIASVGVNIRTAGMQAEHRVIRGVFVVEVPNLAKLQEVMAAIHRLPGITRVERRQRLLHTPSRRRSPLDDEDGDA